MTLFSQWNGKDPLQLDLLSQMLEQRHSVGTNTKELVAFDAFVYVFYGTQVSVNLELDVQRELGDAVRKFHQSFKSQYPKLHSICQKQIVGWALRPQIRSPETLEKQLQKFGVALSNLERLIN